ncbi:MAG: peptide chain release factor N(5)-glutamine methyltransferase [Nocardioidaceae bacterium]
MAVRAAKRLADAGVEASLHDAEQLLAWVLGTSRSGLLEAPPPDRGQVAAYEHAVSRRATREPLQHITGRAGFRYLDLQVGPGVFVPRPETEVMTGIAVHELRRLVAAGVTGPVVVDLCAGSGAVAVSLATEVPAAQVTAVERSAVACAYAERNAAGHGVDVRLGDIADGADDLAGKVHVVTANPPYIPLSAFESVATEARDFDPPEALWAGLDGLDVVRLVASVAGGLLQDGGLVACEHSDVQGDSVPEIFADTGQWSQVRDHCDLSSRPRFVTARRVPRCADVLAR